MSTQRSIDDSPVASAQAFHVGYAGSRETLEDTCEAIVIRMANGELLYVGMIADGMGGIEGGEIASKLAVRTTLDALERGRLQDLPHLLAAALELAHLRVQAAQREVGFPKMGTTATLAAITPDSRLYLAHVGDSRAYLVRGGEIWQLTRDHTWGEEQVRAGAMTPDEARSHERRDALARYIGQPGRLEVDLGIWLRSDESDAEAFANQGLPLQPGDTLVLCSDGLIKNRPRRSGHFVEPEEIVAVVGQFGPQEAVHRLIETALRREADDNISVVVLALSGEAGEGKAAVQAAAPAVPGAPARKGGRAERHTPLALLIGVALLAAVALAVGLVGLSFLTRQESAEPVKPIGVPTVGMSHIVVREVEGTASRLLGDVGLHPVVAGSTLPEGERVVIQTREGSRMAIELEDEGATLYLGPISEVWLEPEPGSAGRRVTLSEGRLLVTRAPGSTGAFTVYAPGESLRASLEGRVMGVERHRLDLATGQPERFIVECLDGPCVFYGRHGPAPLGLEVCARSELSPAGEPSPPQAVEGNHWQDASSDAAIAALCSRDVP